MSPLKALPLLTAPHPPQAFQGWKFHLEEKNLPPSDYHILPLLKYGGATLEGLYRLNASESNGIAPASQFTG